MKYIKARDKGILNSKYEIVIFGVRLKLLQVLFGVIREKRLIEALWGCVCKVSSTCYSKDVSVKDRNRVYYENKKIITCADEKYICRTSSHKVYGEYGNPGSKIFYEVSLGNIKAYDPYKDDEGVYHIHDIINISEGLYYVTTGDSNKYLDLIFINEDKCEILERKIKHLGGFTASCLFNGVIVWGSDFSYRPNYLYANHRKYFLPKNCINEFVIDIYVSSGKLCVLSKKLSTQHGHLTTFNEEYIPIMSEKVRVLDPFIYEAV